MGSEPERREGQVAGPLARGTSSLGEQLMGPLLLELRPDWKEVRVHDDVNTERGEGRNVGSFWVECLVSTLEEQSWWDNQNPALSPTQLLQTYSGAKCSLLPEELVGRPRASRMFESPALSPLDHWHVR